MGCIKKSTDCQGTVAIQLFKQYAHISKDDSYIVLEK